MSEEQPYAVTVGDSVLDYIVTGVGPHPEGFPSRGKSVDIKSINTRPGGMGLNVALSLRKLGERSVLVSWIGRDDREGELIWHEVQQSGIEHTECIWRSKGARTRQCICFVEDSPLRERSFMSHQLPKSRITIELLKAHAGVLRGAKVIHFAGVGRIPAIEDPDIFELLADIKGGEGPIITADTLYDANLRNPRWREAIKPFMSQVDYLMPGDVELEALTDVTFTHLRESDPSKLVSARVSMSELDVAARLMQDMFGVGATVVKLGHHGAYYYEQRNALMSASLYGGFSVVDFADTTGAGDAWCAGFIAGMLHDMPPSECCILGNGAAKYSIGGIGASENVPHFTKLTPLIRLKQWAGLARQRVQVRELLHQDSRRE